MLDDLNLIVHARRVLSGEKSIRTHVQGKIAVEPVPYNPEWRYHLKPDSISFFEASIERCDADMQYVQDHLDEVGGSFLPRFHWCPWNSRLVEKLSGCGL